MITLKNIGLKTFGAAAALSLMALPAYAQQAPQETPPQEMMDHSKMETMDHSKMENMDHSDMEMMDHSKMDHSGHDHSKINPDSAADAAVSEGADTIVAKVNGLVCDFCAQALKKVFKKEEPVESISVDLDAGEVRIFLKDGQSLSDERVAKLIRKSGYSLVGITHEDGA